MKHIRLFAMVLMISLTGCDSDKERHAIIETDMGEITIALYNSTPLHRDNFIKLAKDGYYEGLLFHRVIRTFMIQGGDPESRDASPDAILGSGGPGYTIDAEIGELHLRGALAAARQPDSVNPEKKSSGSQFYIVHGIDINDQYLDEIQRVRQITYTSEQREEYKRLGGYPGLDNDYTVYGQIVSGMDVVNQIANAQTNDYDRPLEDIRILKIRIQ